jgi:hypothetical protein
MVYYWFILKALTQHVNRRHVIIYPYPSIRPVRSPYSALSRGCPQAVPRRPAAIAAARHATPATRHATGLVRFLSLEAYPRTPHAPRPSPRTPAAGPWPGWHQHLGPAGTCGGRRSAEGAMANGLPCLILMLDRSPARQVAVCMQPAGSKGGDNHESRITRSLPRAFWLVRNL